MKCSNTLFWVYGSLKETLVVLFLCVWGLEVSAFVHFRRVLYHWTVHLGLLWNFKIIFAWVSVLLLCQDKFCYVLSVLYFKTRFFFTWKTVVISWYPCHEFNILLSRISVSQINLGLRVPLSKACAEPVQSFRSHFQHQIKTNPAL